MMGIRSTVAVKIVIIKKTDYIEKRGNKNNKRF